MTETIRKHFDRSLTIVVTGFVLMMIYLFSGLFRPISMNSISNVIIESDTLESILISLMSIFISMFVVAVAGTLLAYKMSRKTGRLYKVINGLIILPLLLPPTVAGLVLLQGFGRNSLISTFLFGGQLNVAFNFIGIIVTQVYVTLPFFYQMTLNAFDDVDISYIEAAKVCGADKIILLKQILIPMSIKSMGAGLFMSALRGLSEFGATIMFAGNMAGKTQTITTRIYQLYQTDVNAAFVLAAFQLCVFLIPYYLFIGKRGLSL